jgi:hypothetical protein
MRLLSRLVFSFACLLFTAPVWAAGSTVVYVSGSGGTILSVNTSTGVATTLVTTAGATYEGLVIGPNNDPSNVGGNPAYFLYACDPSHNKIIRFDPNNVAAPEVVYAGNGAAGTLQQPQCGHFDSANDLVVNSKVAGSGAWKIAGAAAVPLGHGGFSAPTQLGTAISAAQVGQAVAGKIGGGVLSVDQAGSQVILSAIQLPGSALTGYNFGPSSAFIKGNLTNPIGIARDNSGLVYVSEHTSNKKGNVQLFDPSGNFLATCVSSSTFGNQQPNFLAITEDGTLYVASASSSVGALWSVTQSADKCTATQIATTTALPQLSGIAVPPTQVTLEASQGGAGTLDFNFGSSKFDVTTGSCDLTVTKSLVPSPAVTNLTANVTGPTNIDGVQVTLNGGVAAAYLSDGGFATKYLAVSTTLSPDSCPAQPFEFLIAAFIDQLLQPNPWIITCNTPGDTSCGPGNLKGIYFLGGFLPNDIGTQTTTPHHSDFFLSNMNLNGGEPATLNLESPLTQVSPPALAGTFSSGSTISVKFKFTPAITDAVAMLSVAQVCQPGTTSPNDPVCGPNGQATVFPIIPVNINAEGSSTTPPPVIKIDNHQQYQFSLSLKGYAPGIYSLTIVVMSGNTAPVTVIIQIT